MTDQEVVRIIRASDDDPNCFSVLVSEYTPLVWTIVTGVVGRRCRDDEEICSEVFLRLWKNRRSFDPDRGSWRGYVMLTARCCARDYLRTVYRKEASLPLEDVQLSQQDHADDLIRRQTISDILDELGEPDRTIITAKYLYCLPQKDIARRLNMSVKAVESRLFRARQQLMERFTQAGLLPSVGRKSTEQAEAPPCAQKAKPS